MYFIWTLDKAIKEAQRINARNMNVSLSYLPVQTKKSKDVEKNTEAYLKILDKIKSMGLSADITLKLHQFGIYGFEKAMYEEVGKVVSYAEHLGILVWIDMERVETVDKTIELFQALRQNHKNVGICLQTCLRRTKEDMERLLADRVPMRLVKGGFYNEYDIKNWEDVTENFSKLMEYMLEHSDKPCIATHDTKLIEKAKKIIQEKNISNAEFQFFYGVKNNLAKQLQNEGFKAVIYIPFGNFFGYMWYGIHTFLNVRNIERILHFKKIF